jgi:hypothetical protein
MTEEKSGFYYDPHTGSVPVGIVCLQVHEMNKGRVQGHFERGGLA